MDLHGSTEVLMGEDIGGTGEWPLSKRSLDGKDLGRGTGALKEKYTGRTQELMFTVTSAPYPGRKLQEGPFRKTRRTADPDYSSGGTGALKGKDTGGTGRTLKLTYIVPSAPYSEKKLQVNAPGYVAKQRHHSMRSVNMRPYMKRRLDDDGEKLQSAKRTKLREFTTIPHYGDSRDNAKSHFAADGDRSGQLSKEALGTCKSSKGNELETAVRSSKTIKTEFEVPCLEEVIGCPFGVLSGVDCDWLGSQSGLIGHSSKSHGVEVQEKSGPFVVELQNVSKSRSFHKAIAICGNLFYLLWVKKEDTMHFLVYGIPKQATEEYTYDFKLKKGQEEISITGGICSSFLQPLCEGIEKGDIIRLHDHKVQKYLDTKGNLSCIIEIRQNENPPSGETDNARVPDASK